MPFILGKKIEMTQIFKDDLSIPVTLIEAGPCWVTQINNEGRGAVQVGFEKLKPGKIKKSQLNKPFKNLKEFYGDVNKYKVGDEIKVDVFKPGEKIMVSGISKGKGFAGVIKRHHFHGQSPSHGHKDQTRMPGSIGSTGPQRVRKGKRMAGRMGGERITVKNLEIIEVNPEKNLLIIKGAVPGRRGSLLEIRS